MSFKQWIITLLIVVISKAETAALSLLSFDPPKFNLSFSSPTPFARFQLLFNNININYEVTSNQSRPASFFIFEAQLEGIDPSSFSTEIYTLIFERPLLLFNGNLSTNDYVLNAEEFFKE